MKIWDIVGEENTLKAEYKVLAGKMSVFVASAIVVSVLCRSCRLICRKDLAWDGESKRIVAVGDGRDK